MKKLKAVLAVVAALAATLAGLDLTGIIAVMPPEVAKVLVIVPSAAAVVVHAVAAFNKALDSNGKTQCHPLVWALALVVALASCSCTLAVDPTTGRLGLSTDPQAVSLIVDRLNQRLTEKLNEKVPPVAVPVTPAK
jgi:hypothetical protein